MRISKTVIGLALVVAVSACGKGGLRALDNPGSGPDEFLIQPVKPLENPDSFAALPEPTPGGANRTDVNPKAEAIAALGGNPAAESAPAATADTALLAATGRYGVDGNIRQDLAEKDAEFRRREKITANIKLFPVDRYADAYRRQALDPYKVNNAYRNAETGTPTAPPQP
ncbi:DUF3035 domain-containing protein [Epibacterium sp. SM1969]|uniref:DUF3035 domain-containing protein n=1 Tax=Tritonibacter aquimaris TaxID=2663379 RepID=A0A844AUQ8_9RHOB|nr:DUF3035 domain-containing protein [Tritonibacter aquimaris]MQY41741.1 DUF3035 domain-containing protein [Tritonibacter aquimaris]